MKILFLGTGNAWGLPNELCDCAICNTMKESDDPKDIRKRTSMYIETRSSQILVDCGPDFRVQRQSYKIRNINALLMTHPHQDHIGGLDDLYPYMWASLDWEPIPLYAHQDALDYIKHKKDLSFMFGFSKNNLLEDRVVRSGTPFDIGELIITPFKTFHGKFAPGSVGYILDERDKRAVYTSDFSYVENSEEAITAKPIDILIIEANWFNEPKKNPWGHMSFQNAMAYIKRWNPKEVYLIHFGNEDQVKEDPMNLLPTKWEPKNPLPYPVPKTHNEWDIGVRTIFSEDPKLAKYSQQRDIISYDGLDRGVIVKVREY